MMRTTGLTGDDHVEYRHHRHNGDASPVACPCNTIRQKAFNVEWRSQLRRRSPASAASQPRAARWGSGSQTRSALRLPRKVMQTAGVADAAATLRLRSAGPDGIFGTGDDVLYAHSAHRAAPVGQPDGDQWPIAARQPLQRPALSASFEQLRRPARRQRRRQRRRSPQICLFVVPPAARARIAATTAWPRPPRCPLKWRTRRARASSPAAVALGSIDPSGNNDYWTSRPRPATGSTSTWSTPAATAPGVIISNAAGGTIFDTNNGG